MEDLMATFGITRHATVCWPSERIRSGSTHTREDHQAYRAVCIVRLFAMIVHDHDHPPLESVVSYWQILYLVASPATSHVSWLVSHSYLRMSNIF